MTTYIQWRGRTIACRKTFQGAWAFECRLGDTLHKQQYMGLPKREALREFKRFLS